MTTQTFEDLIEREYLFERDGMCLLCTEYCWLHNPFIHCQYLEETYNQNNLKGDNIKDGTTNLRRLCL